MKTNVTWNYPGLAYALHSPAKQECHRIYSNNRVHTVAPKFGDRIYNYLMNCQQWLHASSYKDITNRL